jgi:hypothetical protein
MPTDIPTGDGMNLAIQIGELRGTVGAVEREMSDVRRDVGELKKSSTDILSAARTAKIFLGIIVVYRFCF